MARSFAQSVDLECVNCQQPFSAEVWLIVDGVERPDLVARIHDATLDVVHCPHCGTEHPLDAPLLFHDAPSQTLIFASQTHSTVAQDQDVARQLGQQLISAIPVEERDVYLTTAQTVVGIDGLRRVLTGEGEPEGDELSAALQALMAATSPEQVRNAALEHPVLQTGEAHDQLREYVGQLQAGGHSDVAEALALRLDALQPSQPHPTLQFIQALLDAEGPEARQALMQSRPQDVTPEVPTILTALADQAQHRQLEAVARDLLVIRNEVLALLGRDTPVTPSA